MMDCGVSSPGSMGDPQVAPPPRPVLPLPIAPAPRPAPPVNQTLVVTVTIDTLGKQINNVPIPQSATVILTHSLNPSFKQKVVLTQISVNKQTVLQGSAYIPRVTRGEFTLTANATDVILFMPATRTTERGPDGSGSVNIPAFNSSSPTGQVKFPISITITK
jgi:hypothetical protein